MDDLQGRVALVTGASRGIGRAIAMALAQAGADLAINYRARSDDAQTLATAIATLGRRAAAIQADVSAASEVTRLVNAAEQQLGPIDILVNNAGIARPSRSPTSPSTIGTR
jgi:3-oxoacyl-[acyl-carrier protein] reductase